MGVLFGTDGIRGVAGQAPLDRDDVYRIGYCLTGYLKSTHPRPHLLIGRDTRVSGLWIEGLLQRAIEDAGGTPELCGVVSTPAVSFLTRKTAAQAGIMISASHNPYQDNGIKIFSSDGIKFNDAVEDKLETQILSSDLKSPNGFRDDRQTAEFNLSVMPQYQYLYTDYLHSCLAPDFHLKGMRLAVDCAHGSLSYLAPDLLRSLGADLHAIHCQPDGRNINRQAGALHLGALQEEVWARRANLGIAFDGDADRAMFVDAAGRIHDGDDVLYLLARYSNLDDAPRTVVGTVMANLGLEVALEKIGFQLKRTAVGDRYVLEEMVRLGAVIGGEQSGHVIMTRLARTGDGLLTALKVLEIIAQQNQDLTTLCSPVKRFPQVLLNVQVREKVPFEEIIGLHDTEAACKERLGGRSRILLRYSGTEQLARVMVEGEDEQTVLETASQLAAFFK
ncbi:MAG: phosphoglucosamine mutase [Acidobacteriota bacterium]|jgi:phosphoglucosamine mutase